MAANVVQSADASLPKRQKRRTAQEAPDVGLMLAQLIPRLHASRQSLDELVASDDLLSAHAKKQEISCLLAEILALPVCRACFVQFPYAKARSHGAETWRFAGGQMICSFCQHTSLYDGSAEHMGELKDSLRLRVLYMVKQSLARLPSSCVGKTASQLRSACRSLDTICGRGRGPRPGEKQISLTWLCAQMHVLLERLLPEPDFRQERATLLLALRCLEFR